MRWGVARTLPYLLAGILTALLFFGTGCSSSLFSDLKKNAELTNVSAGDGNFNSACFNMDLGSGTLSVATSLKLVNCLNSSGGIQAYADLVNNLEREDPAGLQALVELLNEQLMTKPQRLKELDRSFQQMDDLKILDRTLRTVAALADHAGMIRSAVSLLRQTTRRSGSAFSALTGAPEIDPAVVAAVRILAEDVSRDSTGRYTVAEARAALTRAFEFSARMSTSKAFTRMTEGLRTNIGLLNPDRNLPFFTRLVLEYVKTKIRSHQTYGKLIAWGIEDGTFLEAFDHYFSRQCDGALPSACRTAGAPLEVDGQIAAMEEFLRVLMLEQKEKVFKPLSDLFRELNGPMKLMGGTKEVPNMDLFVMNEFLKIDPLQVPAWVMRTNTVKLAIASSMAEYPKINGSFNDATLALRWLAGYPDPTTGARVRGRPLITVAHFTKGLQVADELGMGAMAYADIGSALEGPPEERYRRLLIRLLGDKDTNVNVYTHAADLVAELVRPERAVIGNLLFFLNIPNAGSTDRRDLQASMRSLLTPHTDLGTPARSVYDLLADQVLRADEGTVLRLASAVSDFIDKGERVIEPLAAANRDALLMNNSNALIEIVLDVALHAEKYTRVFDALFRSADSDRFERALTLTARMSRDGKLKDLLKGLLVLFRNGRTGNVDHIVVKPVPPIAKLDESRDRSRQGLPAWNPLSGNWPGAENQSKVDACYRVNFDIPFGRTSSTGWERLVRDMGACLNAFGDNREVEALIDYGLRAKVDSRRSMLSFLVDLIGGVIPGDLASESKVFKSIYDEASDLLIVPRLRAQMQELNAILPVLFEENRYCSVYIEGAGGKPGNCPAGAERLAVFQALVRTLSPISNQGEKVQTVVGVLKPLVESPHLPRSAGLLYEVGQDVKELKRMASAGDERARLEIERIRSADPKPPLQSSPLNAYPANNLLRAKFDQVWSANRKRLPTQEEYAEAVALYWGQSQSHLDRSKRDSSGRLVSVGYRNVVEVKEQIRPLLDELARPERLEGALRFFHYMDANPYNPEWWASWFRRAAANITAIPYYYPGQIPGKHAPTIRFISELDALELIVLDGDFTLGDYGMWYPGMTDTNSAIKYLTLLGQAQDGVNPNTLEPTLNEMRRELDFFWSIADSIIGGIVKGEVKRRLFNLRQAYPMLRGMNRVSQYRMDDGRIITANDLGVLRDLFKRVLDATPPELRNVYDKKKNSMAAIIGLVQAGILRNAGTNLWVMNTNADPMVKVNPDDDDREHRAVVPNEASNALRFLIDAAMVKEGETRKVNPDSFALMSHLLREDCDRSAGAPSSCVPAPGQPDKRTFDQRYVTIAKVLNKFWDWIDEDEARAARGETTVQTLLKRSGYYSMQLFDRLGVDSSGQRPEDLYRKVTKVLRALLGDPRGTEVVGDNLDLLDDVVTEPDMPLYFKLLLDSEFSEVRYGDKEYSYKASTAFSNLRDLSILGLNQIAAGNATPSAAFVDLFYPIYKSKDFEPAKAAVKWMFDDPEFKRLTEGTGSLEGIVKRVFGQVMRWMPKETNAYRQRELRGRLQQYLGRLIGNGDIRELVLFLARQANDDALYSQVKFIGRDDYVKKLNSMMDELSNGPIDIYGPREALARKSKSGSTAPARQALGVVPWPQPAAPTKPATRKAGPAKPKQPKKKTPVARPAQTASAAR